MRTRTAAVTLALLMAHAPSASAAEKNTPANPPEPVAAAVARTADSTPPPALLWTPVQRAPRPSILPVLYGTYAALQGMDAVSTRRALAAGAGEANPLMNSGHLGAMLAVKAAGGAATIYIAERAWKKNRAGAIVLMAALNGATAAIAARNIHNARR
jgi:hypothetical protein